MRLKQKFLTRFKRRASFDACVDNTAMADEEIASTVSTPTYPDPEGKTTGKISRVNPDHFNSTPSSLILTEVKEEREDVTSHGSMEIDRINEINATHTPKVFIVPEVMGTTVGAKGKNSAIEHASRSIALEAEVASVVGSIKSKSSVDGRAEAKQVSGKQTAEMEWTQLKSNSSWTKNIKKHISEVPVYETKEKRKVSFHDKCHYIENDGEPYHDDEEEDSSFDSDDYSYMSEDDDICTLLCGCDNLNLNRGNLEHQNNDRCFKTAITSDDESSVGITTNLYENTPYKQDQIMPACTLSLSKFGKTMRRLSPDLELPSLLKKSTNQVKLSKDLSQAKQIITKEQPETEVQRELRTEQTAHTQPCDSPRFSRKIQTTKNEVQYSAEDATAANDSIKRRGDKIQRQLEVYCKRHGGVENLVLRKYPSIPLPAEKYHVLIKIEASTVSFHDCFLRLHGDPDQQPLLSVPGCQIIGTIHSLGSALKSDGKLQIGDRVAALTQGGGNARFISVPAKSVIVLPPTAVHENTICLVSNYMTAYQALKMAKMKKGGAPLTNSHVLITGGSGPIGQALIDLASREGAIVYTTAHKMHQEHLSKNLKAEWFPVNPSEWLPTLEGQMDVVVDSLSMEGYESSYKALAQDGVLICTRNFSAEIDSEQSESIFESKKVSLWWADIKAKHMWKNCYFYNIYESYANDPKLFQKELMYLYLQMENGSIKPKVAGRVSLNQVPKAQRLIEKGLPNGTVILNPWKKLDPKQNVPIERCDKHSI